MDTSPLPARGATGDERRRVAPPRRSTRGPLDAALDDPLSPSLDARIPSPKPRPGQRVVLSPTRSEHDGSVTSPLTDISSKDFSYLQDPTAYHVLPASNVPAPFLNAPNAASVTAPIDTLLSSGHFRLAAIAAARNIVQAASPADYQSLFHLLHIRLACLCLISEHAIAAQESKILGDLNSAFYRHPLTDAHLVPWDLRLLTVRLSALGYGEWRKGIMGYYELAQECRDMLAKCGADGEEEAEKKQLWRSRLRDCGIRVANVLVEMGELEGAGRHLASLSSPSHPADTPEAQQILYMEALVWLRIGDTRAARRCLASATPSAPTSPSPSTTPPTSDTLEALIHLANSDYPAATEAFTALHTSYPTDAMITQNLAICLLYTGHIAAARAMLTELAETTPPFRSLVFNLSTIYELCTERNRDRKSKLAEKLAAREPEGVVGWEIMSGDFKL